MTELIQRYDPKGMRNLILNFPKQAAEAVAIGNTAKIKIETKNIEQIVVSGLGGSAIGGDLLRAYLADKCAVPVVVNRHYYFPDYVGKNSLVIISSYSGNTEETTASYKDAIKRKAKIFCITSGGEVERMAKKHKHPYIKIPGGFPPRAALGYSFFPTLIALSKLGFIKDQKKEIKETLALLNELSVRYSNHDTADNLALNLAKTIHGKLPLIYSAADKFDTVNTRWRGQITENAKTLAFGHVFPELNHNEIVGWEVLKDLMKKMHVIILRDKDDYKRIQLRMDVTKGIIGDLADGITEVHSEGKSLLSRMFSLLYLADWLSFYLAMLNGVDPSPVKKIDFLKEELGKVK
ncbi:MAG: bifunctional phosphoglucose/phosphomannose isomerase [Ignavibacteriales bacterium]|nr:bifunctional phosphoglucose/phosphomannose isomerase [Ignavibacteriales bacterium]